MYGVLGAVGLVIVLSSIAIVPAGNIGVKLTWSAVQGYNSSTLPEGIHFVWPIAQSVVAMNTQVQLFQTHGDSAQSSDLQNVTTDVGVNYHILPTDAAFIFDRYSVNYAASLITPILQESLKATTANFTAEQLIDNRPAVQSELQNRLTNALANYDIHVDQVSLTNFAFSPQYQLAIENKTAAQQKLLQEQIQLQTAHVIANQTVALAQGNATARVVQANGTATAAHILQQAFSTNPAYIQYLAVTEWKGNLPYVVGGNGVLPLIDLNLSNGSSALNLSSNTMK